jgi:hypothetical protein
MRFICGFAFALWLSFPAQVILWAQESPAQQNEPAEASSSPKASTPDAKKRHKRTPAVVHSDPRKVVVPEGGAKEPPSQIAPGLAPDEAGRERREADQWLSSTDAQLKVLADRRLSVQQQDTVGQVRNYLVEARSALQENDLRRAHTLALKAHLLSDELIKH